MAAMKIPRIYSGVRERQIKNLPLYFVKIIFPTTALNFKVAVVFKTMNKYNF